MHVMGLSCVSENREKKENYRALLSQDKYSTIYFTKNH